MVVNNIHAEETIGICRDGRRQRIDKRVGVGEKPMSVEDAPDIPSLFIYSRMYKRW
jgi:hypothetical protein